MMDAHLFRPGIDIAGRPDHGNRDFGVVRAKRFPKYVHSTNRSACLIHKVEEVEIHWYSGHYDWCQRLENPRVIARTNCGTNIFLSNGKKSGKMCEIPDPNAVLCGRCHGEPATFSRKRVQSITKQWAHDHLGCKGLREVIGPYEKPSTER